MSNDTAIHTATDSTAPPVLAAWRDGRQLWAWCEHEKRWHRHSLKPGTRSAGCTCLVSPCRETGYQLNVAGPLTPAVIAAHAERAACMECSAAGECSCGEPVCDGSYYYCGTRCARHAHDECGGCWRTHGGPGYGACRQHGILKMHSHRYASRCEVEYLAADEDSQQDCELAADVIRYWPAADQDAGVHVHCPVCAANSLTWRAENAAWMRLNPQAAGYAPEALTGAQPLCPGCRKLITPAWTRWLAAQVHRWDSLVPETDRNRWLGGAA